MNADDTTPMSCGRCDLPHERCAGHNRLGLPCRLWPLAGQRVCGMHGGKAPKALAAASRRLEAVAATNAVRSFGLPVEVDPHTALLQELARTAGAVAWLDAVVRGIKPKDVTWGKTQVKRGGDDWGTTSAAGVNTWVQLWQVERRHLLDVSKACIAAGIEERRVELETARVALVAKGAEKLLAYVPAAQRDEAIQVFLDELRSLEAAS